MNKQDKAKKVPFIPWIGNRTYSKRNSESIISVSDTRSPKKYFPRPQNPFPIPPCLTKPYKPK